MRLALALDDLLDQSKAHGHKIGEVLQDITGNMVDFGRFNIYQQQYENRFLLLSVSILAHSTALECGGGSGACLDFVKHSHLSILLHVDNSNIISF